MEKELQLSSELYMIVYPLEIDVVGLDLAKHGLTLAPLETNEHNFLFREEEFRVRVMPLVDGILRLRQQQYCYLIKADEEERVWAFYRFLTLIKPSCLRSPVTVFNIEYHIKDGQKHLHQILSVSSWPSFDHFNFVDRLVLKDDFVNANYILDKFLKKAADSGFEKLMDVYIAATANTHDYLRFVLFMMLIETLIVDDETQGITFKIRRTCAVLLGFSEKLSDTIFSNINKLYAVRSKIVHSADSKTLTDEKLYYLHAIVCAVLQTFIVADIDLKRVFSTTNKFGFGQRPLLLKQYGVEQEYIMKSILDTLSEEVKK